MNTATYFDRLSDVAVDLIGTLPLSADPLPIAEISGRLTDLVEAQRADALELLRARAPHTGAPRLGNDGSAGLNTVGMLSDRLTILLIKFWYMTNIYGDRAGAAALRKTNIAEIIAALASARPGAASMNTKVTTHRIEGKADNWEEAFHGLLMTNLLLWESQEILYQSDIQALPETELRGYLAFFSKGNLTRNQFIELCEKHYWKRDCAT